MNAELCQRCWFVDLFPCFSESTLIDRRCFFGSKEGHLSRAKSEKTVSRGPKHSQVSLKIACLGDSLLHSFEEPSLRGNEGLRRRMMVS